MPLSIRNPHAEKLARELAVESGESITQVIIHALEDRLERLKGRRQIVDIADEIIKISKRCLQLPDQDKRSPEEILGYNDFGVPN